MLIKTMKTRVKAALAAVYLAAACSVRADAETNVPPPKVTLLGMACVAGTKKVILQMVDRAKAGQRSQNQDAPFVLAEGESQHGVEAREIDVNAGSVKAINHGVAMTLTFKENGVNPPHGPAPATATGPGTLVELPIPLELFQPVPMCADSPLLLGATAALGCPSFSDCTSLGRTCCRDLDIYGSSITIGDFTFHDYYTSNGDIISGSTMNLGDMSFTDLYLW